VVKAQIWDCAGQERFKSITTAYYRGSVGAIVMFDITDFASFKSVAHWLKELRDKCNENIVILLVGNKSDRDKERVVDKSAAATYAAKHGIAYVETCATSGTNIVEAFELIINEIYRVLRADGEIEKSLDTSQP